MLASGRNSVKFVSSGFIRFSAKVNAQGWVQLAVEDSGPGIPKEKRQRLFSKFQESLDVLSQGTVCRTCVTVQRGTLERMKISLTYSFKCISPLALAGYWIVFVSKFGGLVGR